MARESDGSAQSDKDLVARCAARDDAAVRELLDLYGKYVYGVIHHVLGSKNAHWVDAGDVYQEVMVDLVAKSLARYAGECSLRYYCARVAKYKALDLVRKRQRRGNSQPLRDDQAGETHDPVAAERKAAVLQAFSSLDDACRSLLESTVIEGKPPRVVAPKLGTSANVVSKRRQRCLEKLRSLLARLGVTGAV